MSTQRAAPPDDTEYPEIVHLDRASVILRIRLGLQRRSDKAWSVRGGVGTAYGWITVASPPSRCDGYLGTMSDEDRRELADLLGLDEPVQSQGYAVADSFDHYREAIDRAEGRAPRVVAEPYWD
jgi:hypothetical protein